MIFMVTLLFLFLNGLSSEYRNCKLHNDLHLKLCWSWHNTWCTSFTGLLCLVWDVWGGDSVVRCVSLFYLCVYLAFYGVVDARICLHVCYNNCILCMIHFESLMWLVKRSTCVFEINTSHNYSTTFTSWGYFRTSCQLITIYNGRRRIM